MENVKYKNLFTVVEQVAQNMRQVTDALHLSAALEAAVNAVTNAPAIQAASQLASNQTIVAAQDIAANLFTNTLFCEQYQRLIESLTTMARTPELEELYSRLQQQDVLAAGMYLHGITAEWEAALSAHASLMQGIASQNIAVLRMVKGFESLALPYGGQAVMKALTKASAAELTRTDQISFDPKDRKFYHEENPEQKISADSITVVQSSMALFADISFSDLVAFESVLMDNAMQANRHPIGRKIYETLKKWNHFINFDRETFFYARSLSKTAYFTDQEMLKAPENVASHGRYNPIGKSCYYFAESRDGAVNEILKHSGGQRPRIQVAEIRPVRLESSIRLLDLSEQISGVNIFAEHMRCTVENKPGIIIKEYLLPNYVASCCKDLRIDGIKYRSGSYDCYVTWKDDYFEFVRREIVETVIMMTDCGDKKK